MNIKQKIKNDLWRINYILPFARKDIAGSGSRKDLLRSLARNFKSVHPVVNKSVAIATLELFKSIEINVLDDSTFVYFLDASKTLAVPGNIIDNFSIDYSKIIYESFESHRSNAVGEDQYGKDAKIICDAIELLRHRIENELKKGTKDAKRAQKIIWFERLLNNKAEHFDEALQRILFFNQILWQTRHRLNGLGRLDKILGPVYQHDLENGYLDQKNAKTLIGEFLTILGRYHSYKSTALYGDIGQIIILGGTEKNGSYFYNDLTKLFLSCQSKNNAPDPKTILRVSRQTPSSLLALSVECLRSATGSPLFSNDDVIIPALIDAGIVEEDAYNYCTSACWEPFIVGNSFDQNNMQIFDYFEGLDSTLKQNEKMSFQSFDELLQAYRKENIKNARVTAINADEIKWAKDPIVSILTNDCNRKRKDISDGGAKYNNYGITTVGLPNVINSLLTIRDLVFDKHEYTLSELETARLCDYEGYEDIYKRIVSHTKAFGYDKKESIQLINILTGDVVAELRKHSNNFGGQLKIGISSPDYIKKAKSANADYSGRKKGDPYITHISADGVSLTELVRFASKLEYDKGRCNGNVVDFFISPSLIEKHFDKFELFLRGAIDTGFFQMQMNVMDSNTLIAAKKNPQDYPGLIVRVWGFSAYFVELPENYQDLLIERARQAEKI